MAEVFAGFVVGYAMSLLAGPLAAYMILRANRAGLAERIAPPGTNFVALSMVLHFGAMLFFTAVGMLLGLALHGVDARRPADGLGSPNVAYTAIVLALGVALALPAAIVPALRRYAFAGALVFIVAFGWGVPWLASAG